MILHVLRALFVLLMAAVGYSFMERPARMWGNFSDLTMAVALSIGVLVVCIDILTPRRKVFIFSGTFFGLVVGSLIAYGFSFVVNLLVADPDMRLFLTLMVGVTACYLSVSFILQTKDDFRFIIPYVEFSKQTKGARPILIDTSVLIDGRIADIVETGILESQLIVPRFVLTELQLVADSSDRLKRNRGRRGLDILNKMQGSSRVEIIHYDTSSPMDEEKGVDERLVDLAAQLKGRVLTTDFNLNKVAQLRGVDVININDLSTSLKPIVLPGERMQVRLMRPGEEAGQGVGYLDDGTMVVVEQGRPYLNEEVEFNVTSMLQTSAGKMIFGRLVGPVTPSAGGNLADKPPASAGPAPQETTSSGAAAPNPAHRKHSRRGAE